MSGNTCGGSRLQYLMSNEGFFRRAMDKDQELSCLKPLLVFQSLVFGYPQRHQAADQCAR